MEKDNKKIFDTYVFISTFSRCLIETFIPVILYKYGFSLKDLLLYFLVFQITSLLLSYPFAFICKKGYGRFLSFVGIIAFIAEQVYLNFITHTTTYLITTAVIYGVYRRAYWISRRFFNMQIMQKNEEGKSYSITSIFNQLAIIAASYIGSLLLEFLSTKVVTIISIALFVMSIIPLKLMKFKIEVNDMPIDVKHIFKTTPKQDFYIFGAYELQNILKFLFPLYLIIYIRNTYQTIGIVQLISNIAIILFTYIFGRKLDFKKKDYIRFSTIFICVVYFCKINVTYILLLIVSFIEGFATKMYELSENKAMYSLSKKYEYNSYNLAYEITQNVFRLALATIFYIFNFDIRTMMYITLLVIASSALFKFEEPNIPDLDMDKIMDEKEQEKISAKEE